MIIINIVGAAIIAAFGMMAGIIITIIVSSVELENKVINQIEAKGGSEITLVWDYYKCTNKDAGIKVLYTTEEGTLDSTIFCESIVEK